MAKIWSGSSSTYASSKGSGKSAPMLMLTLAFVARKFDKYQTANVLASTRISAV